MRTLLLVHFAALAAHLEAVAEMLRQEVEAGVAAAAPPASCPSCGAAEDKIEDASTIGIPTSRCTVCGAEWDQCRQIRSTSSLN